LVANSLASHKRVQQFSNVQTVFSQYLHFICELISIIHQLGAPMSTKLFLHQEIMLLAIRDDSGRFSGGMYLYSVAGAMVSELLMRQRIVGGREKNQVVGVIDKRPTGDELLDELLQQILASKKPSGIQHWVSKAANMPKLKHRIAGRLCDLGILRQDEKKVLWVFTQQVYPELDGTCEDAIRNRMAKVMFDEAVKPDGPTAVLIALASHGGLLKPNFRPEELRQHKDRIKQLAQGDILAADATQSAIQAVQTAIMVAAILPAIIVTTTSSR
jgi:Golgi phosphoprotein 3